MGEKSQIFLTVFSVGQEPKNMLRGKLFLLPSLRRMNDNFFGNEHVRIFFLYILKRMCFFTKIFRLFSFGIE
ncbi:MAG: hypothetical protein COZ29_02130 [Candidatus Moranbacteria bacterium CG_4_10_14_3_um_filter_45_9]|nr:MAG: hypothetical protein AUK19_01365 [Candidatus Moranbacteria bacterium CG2_30_45_14]PIX90018.1 MAG: hypothetical protein COZ29_02130 [Candidatus Moranbacteria bacterium CG_4_10_14_3_um_filter_45_9]PJA85280.1 MAG: hypothetical protein CO143_01950 [Candidatus Moranbacteria bacterium CG_4_9_14_3_um_filter_45_14]